MTSRAPDKYLTEIGNMRIWGHGDVWGYDLVKVKVEMTRNGKFGQCGRFMCVIEF